MSTYSVLDRYWYRVVKKGAALLIGITSLAHITDRFHIRDIQTSRKKISSVIIFSDSRVSYSLVYSFPLRLTSMLSLFVHSRFFPQIDKIIYSVGSKITRDR